MYQVILDMVCGIRIVMDYENSIPTNGEPPQRAADGVLQCECGYLPKDYGLLRYALEKYKETNEIYTTDARPYREDTHEKYQPKQNRVYRKKGREYVNIATNYLDGNEQRLADPIKTFEVQPVKWLIDDKAKTMMAEMIVYGGVEYDSINMILEILSKEIFQKTKEINLTGEENRKKGFWYKLFHKIDKMKALPEGTYQIDYGNTNDEQEVGTEIAKSEQNDINEFHESIRQAAKAETKVTEEVAKANPIKEKVNNIPDAQINRDDGKIYPQHQYYAKPQAAKTDRTYYVKGEDGELCPTRDANNSDYYIGLDGVLRPTKEPIENYQEDGSISENGENSKPVYKVDLSKPPYISKRKQEQNNEMPIREDNQSAPRAYIPKERFIKPTEDVDQDDGNER